MGFILYLFVGQIAELKVQQSEGDLGDFRGVSRKLGEVRTQMDNLKQRNFTQRGSLNQIDSNIDRNKKELGAKQYHNIDQDYKDKQIELRCTEMANRDLDKYYQVGLPFPLYSNISFEFNSDMSCQAY